MLKLQPWLFALWPIFSETESCPALITCPGHGFSKHFTVASELESLEELVQIQLLREADWVGLGF